MRRRSRFSHLILAGLLVWFATNMSRAATIEPYSDPVMGCRLLLSGTIVEGDADRLQTYLSERNWGEEVYLDGLKICLNSSGGSFLEGIRIAELVMRSWRPRIGTAISEGHACESACALAFMGSTAPIDGDHDITDTPIKPIMHPRSRLGFHAPSLQIRSGAYTEGEVMRAWDLSIEAIARIIELRAASYVFPERLLLNMLSTRPDSMYLIDTVEKARLHDIRVSPVGINGAPPQELSYNLCSNVGYTSMAEWTEMEISPEMRADGDGASIFFPEGFLSELAFSCRILIKEIPYVSLGDGDAVPVEDEILTYPADTKLSALSTNAGESWGELVSRIRAETRVPVTAYEACWLSGETALVTNVESFTNLRTAPGLSSEIISQVNRGETVRLLDRRRGVLFGPDEVIGRCRDACRALYEEVGDVTAQAKVHGCVRDNTIWYQVEDRSGTRGWLSRKFLTEP